MKKSKKWLIYLVSALIPVLIFFICACINKYYPYGDKYLSVSDAYFQYPGFLLEYARLLKSGNIFFSWHGALGFNFFSSLTYYGMSPLNLICLFANPDNYLNYATLMVYIRFALMGLTMCFYLDKKGNKPLYTIVFSILYSLIGFTSTYYYNYLWMDSIMMLPLVIHGIDNLIEKKTPTFYIVTLTITILINYYIGYMICIFSCIWFLYCYLNLKKEERKGILKRFIISSLLAGLMCAVTIIPSYFALRLGKGSIYETTNYAGLTENFNLLFAGFAPGAYKMIDISYGPALVYSSLFVLVLVSLYFFNTQFSKREKILTAFIIIFFFLSFSVNFLNCAWQFFQTPIWWQSRFSFTFSFFLLVLACRTLANIKDTKISDKMKLVIGFTLIALLLISEYTRWQNISAMFQYVGFYIMLSTILILTYILLINRKKTIYLMIILLIIEVSMNTFNNLMQNGSETNDKYQNFKDIPNIIEKLNDENSNFYRFESTEEYMSNDGLFFGYNGINYFNSVRNQHSINLLNNLGARVIDDCNITLTTFDPVFLSLFNIKYLYGENIDYLNKIDAKLYENKYPLALGYTVNKDILDFKLNSDNPIENKDILLKTMTGLDLQLYTYIDEEKFNYEETETAYLYTYNFTSDDHYLLMPSRNASLKINGKNHTFKDTYLEINKKDKVELTYTIKKGSEDYKIYLGLLYLNNYPKYMEELNVNLLSAKTNINGHILEGTIDLEEDDYLFTSIAYEEGMKVFVDGQEVKPDILLDTVIGLNLEKGSHIITIDYIPKGFKTGTVISIIASILSIIYITLLNKKYKTSM